MQERRESEAEEEFSKEEVQVVIKGEKGQRRWAQHVGSAGRVTVVAGKPGVRKGEDHGAERSRQEHKRDTEGRIRGRRWRR